MADVGEHHAEKEREGDDSEEARVDFLIARDAVGVDDFLEYSSDFIELEIRWRCLVEERLDLLNLASRKPVDSSGRDLAKRGLHCLLVPGWEPEASREDGTLHNQIVEVQIEVLLLDDVEPNLLKIGTVAALPDLDEVLQALYHLLS